jgi:hypothetical protein
MALAVRWYNDPRQQWQGPATQGRLAELRGDGEAKLLLLVHYCGSDGTQSRDGWMTCHVVGGTRSGRESPGR